MKSREAETRRNHKCASENKGTSNLSSFSSSSNSGNSGTDTEVEHTILIVDDEKSVLNSLKRMLAGEEYRIVTAECLHEVLDLISANRFSVIISDYSMPSISGAELLAIVKKRHPHCIRIMLTGATESDIVPDQISESILNCQRFITKPWDNERLRQIIRECLQQYEASSKS